MTGAAHGLAGRRIVVTGASRGIGAAIARRLAALGAGVVLVARDQIALDEVRASLPGGPHRAVAIDVTDEQGWIATARQLEEEGSVHGLVAAAGVLGPIGPPGSWTISAFQRTIEVNLVGVVLPVIAFLEPLRAVHGAIVAVAGGGAASPLPRFDAYAASKAALVRLAENLAIELAPDGVRVNCVAPGFVATGMHGVTLEAGPELAGPDYYEKTRATVKAGGDPPELAAELTSFLLSEEAGGITGKLISAKWDPWKEPLFRERLRREPDLACLRRIDDHFFSAVPRPAGCHP